MKKQTLNCENFGINLFTGFIYMLRTHREAVLFISLELLKLIGFIGSLVLDTVDHSQISADHSARLRWQVTIFVIRAEADHFVLFCCSAFVAL